MFFFFCYGAKCMKLSVNCRLKSLFFLFCFWENSEDKQRMCGSRKQTAVKNLTRKICHNTNLWSGEKKRNITFNQFLELGWKLRSLCDRLCDNAILETKGLPIPAVIIGDWYKSRGLSSSSTCTESFMTQHALLVFLKIHLSVLPLGSGQSCKAAGICAGVAVLMSLW